MPPWAVGKLFLKSSRGREWLDHSAATMVHPGFHGNITYEVVNVGPRPYVVKSGMRIVHMEIQRMAAPAEVPYFAQKSAKYHGQKDELQSRDKKGDG